MQFKHPEILFALFLLIIPIIIHLFQLRRFKKVAFTNVQFLKDVELETRKSANLKKWLVLASRLLMFAALILSFAQPFFSHNTASKPTSTHIYLDNSYSMQAEGEHGELFKRAVQEIIEGSSNLDLINLYTNDGQFKNLSKDNLIKTLQNLDYSPSSSDIAAASLKMHTNLKERSNLFFISDFQSSESNKIQFDSINNYFLSQVRPLQFENISIDSLYITNQNNENLTLKVLLNNFKVSKKDISVSIVNTDNMLLGKSNVVFDTPIKEVTFSIPNTNEFLGKIHMEDGYLNFDNTLYFTLIKPKKVNVTSIQEGSDFLRKIYTEEEFDYTATNMAGLDYNSLNNQHLVILNGVNPSSTLTDALVNYLNQGGNLVIVPSEKPDIGLLNKLLAQLGGGIIQTDIEMERSITSINFSHPLIKGVFEKEVSNFQYPTSKQQLIGKYNNATHILNYENGDPFIAQLGRQTGKLYLFTSPLVNPISNFTNSPLIVPIFYNFGIYSHQPSRLYYTIGTENRIEVDVSLKKDEILQLRNDEETYIPLQEINKQKVAIMTKNTPAKDGFAQILSKDEKIGTLAFNYNRKEAKLQYDNANELFANNTNVFFDQEVGASFKQLTAYYKSKGIWKILIGIALFFLIVEILLLKSKL